MYLYFICLTYYFFNKIISLLEHSVVSKHEIHVNSLSNTHQEVVEMVQSVKTSAERLPALWTLTS